MCNHSHPKIKLRCENVTQDPEYVCVCVCGGGGGGPDMHLFMCVCNNILYACMKLNLIKLKLIFSMTHTMVISIQYFCELLFYCDATFGFYTF